MPADPAVPSNEPPVAPSPRSNISAIPRVTSQDLLGACGQLVIAHAGREYRLSITRNGKLILTA